MRLVAKGTLVVAVLALLLFAAPSAYGNACISNATGNWSAAGTWTACGGVVPTSADTVEIRSGLTVTVDVSNAVAASIQVGGVGAGGAGFLVFNSGSQVVVSGIVTLGGSALRPGTITMTNGGTLTASSLAIGVATKTWTPGTGTVELTATNTIPATIFTSFNNLTVTAGTTTLGAIVTVSSSLTVSGTLQLVSFSLTSGDLQGAGVITSSSGTPTLTTGSNNTSTTFSGVIGTGAIALTKNGTGVLTFSGSNNYTGLTTVAAGTLQLNNTNALGTTAGATSVTSGAVLDLNGINYSNAETLTLNGTGISTGGVLINSNAIAASYAGNISLASATRITANNPITLSGIVSGSGALTVAGAGNSSATLTLSGANTYTNTTTITANAWLKIGSTSALGAGTSPPGSDAASGNHTAINSGGVLDLNGISYSSSLPEGVQLNGTGISGGGCIINSSSTPANFVGFLDAYTPATINVSNPITLSGPVQVRNNNHLTKTGADTLTFAPTGGERSSTIIVNAGTVKLGANEAQTGATTITSGATWDLNGFTCARSVTLNGTGISGAGALMNSSATGATWSGAVTLGSASSINGETGTIAITGAITGAGFGLSLDGAAGGSATGIISGTGTTLTKLDAGTWTLSGLNTYTGTTTISGGILRATNNTIVASTNGAFGRHASGLLLDGGTIQSNVATFSRPLTVTATDSGLDAYGSARTLSSTITLSTAGTFNLNVGGTTAASAEGQNLTLSGVISYATGTLSLTKIGTSSVSFGTQTVTLLNLTISAGALTSTSGTLNLAGNFSNNATFTHNSGTVNFNGTGTNTITGSSTTAFNTITINKGTDFTSNILDVQSLITMTAGGLTLTNGTFKLSSASTITPFAVDIFNAPFLIPSTAGLWVNAGTVSTTSDVTFAGLLRVSNGVLNVGNVMNQRLRTANGAAVVIDGGTLNVAGRLIHDVSTDVISFTMSAGTLNVPTISTGNMQAPFTILNPASSFAMSGGTIVIVSGGTTGAGYANDAGTSNVTGGTLQIGSASTPASALLGIHSVPPVWNLTVNGISSTLAQLYGSALTVKNNVTLTTGTLNADTFNLTVGGNWTNNVSTTAFTAGTGTVTFNGTNAQAVAGSFATTFNNLTISNTGNTVTSSVNSSVSGDLSVSSGTFDLGSFTANRGSAGGTLTVSSGATLKIGGTNTLPSNYSTHSIGGTSTIEYSGTNQSLAVLNSAQNYENLTISGSGTKTLAGDVSVGGTLLFTNGTITTGVNNLQVKPAGSVTRVSGHVIGNLKKNIATGATSQTYEVGDASNYTPVTVAFASVSTPGNLTGSTVSTDHANIGTSTINPAKSVNRNWTLTNNGGLAFTTYDVTFTFVGTDVDGGANTNAFIVGKYSAGWTYPTVVTKTATTTLVTGLTAFSDFQIGEIAATYTISGHIQNGSAVAISGVTLTLSDGQAGTTTTDGSGNYSFANLPSGLNYTVTPSKTNYAFSPTSLTYTALSADQTAADFTGTDFSGTAPPLGASTTFAVLAGTTVTSTGLTVVSGNIGVSPGTAVTGFPPGVLQNGQIYSGGGSLAGPAQASAFTAYNDLVGQGCLPANNLSGKILGVSAGAVTLGPGVYCFDTTAQLTSNLTLDDGGDPDALFIFQIGTTLTTASGSQVLMSSSGRGTNVYWQIGTSATIGTSTIFRGNIIASTSITTTTGASTTGRLFAITGAVTLDTNIVDAVPAGTPPYISGHVFEDKNYGGGAGRSLTSSSGIARASVRVELFDSGGTYQTFTTTDGSGNYILGTLPAGTYTVRVVNSSVTSSRGGTSLLPVQTFRTNASSGAAVDVTDHVGGETPGLADAGNGSTTLAALTTGTTTAQSITTVVLSSSDIIGVDFGYSFNVIVNKSDADQGSLRQFITNANALSNTGLAQSGLTAGIDNAVFMLADGTARPGLTSSYATQFASSIASITLATVLPTIADPVILDASLQPGYANLPMIELNGAAVANAGLTITAGNSTVRGFIINRFTSAAGNGISISTGGSNTITGNHIGTNALGTAASANASDGISISSSNNTIGGITATARNVISGNTGDGISFTGAGTTGNLVQGNYIGTNAAGIAALANGVGVYLVSGATNNTIGGTTATARNVISGNTTYGVVISSAATNGNLVQGNYIGLNEAGTAALANNVGIYLVNGPADNTIGGTAAGAGNVVSGNASNGIRIQNSTGTLVQGNRIGTNAAGTAAIGNTLNIFLFTSAVNNTIGGTVAGARNVISGSTGHGVRIDGVGSTGNLVQGNYIGTDAAGTAALANSSNGVFISGGATSNTIGGTAAGAGNLISGNASKGVVILAGTDNAILSNSIYGNTGIGIDLTNDGVTANDGTKSGALANFGMDTPVFSTMTLAGTTLTVTGYVGSAASQALFAGASVQVFKSDTDSSGFGEGQTFLGTLTADASGNFSGTVTVTLAVGDKITATATDASNNTSEFGANATVANPPPSIAHVSSVIPAGEQIPGTDLVYTATFTNSGGQPAQAFIVVDPIPTHTDFKLGSPSTVLGTTGMTVTVEFSDNGGSTWTYTPVSGGGGALAGYDRTVTHVRWRFTGNLSQTAPNNAGSVTVTTRIQ